MKLKNIFLYYIIVKFIIERYYRIEVAAVRMAKKYILNDIKIK